MRKMLKNHLRMLKLAAQSDRLYIPLNIINLVLQFLTSVLHIIFFKYALNYLLQDESDLILITMQFAVYYLFINVVQIISYYVANIYIVFATERFKKTTQTLIYSKAQDIDFSAYEDNNFHDMYARATDNPQLRLISAADYVFKIIRSVLFISTLTHLLAGLNYIYILFAIILTAYNLLNIKLSNNFFLDYNHKIYPPNRRSKYFENLFINPVIVKELKAFDAYKMMSKKYVEARRIIKTIKKKGIIKLLRFTFSTNIIGLLIDLCLASLIIYQILNSMLTVGDFALIILSVTRLTESFNGILSVFLDMKKENVLIEYFLTLIDIQKNHVGMQNLQHDDTKRVIILNNVAFSYPNKPNIPVLSGINLVINQSERLAIVGQNGSGKSSLIKLLLSTYSEYTGSITYNGIIYEMYSKKALQAEFYALFQDSCIFNMSIAENILMREVSSKEDIHLVEAALDFSGLLDKVRGLEKGIYTEIGREFDENGVYLSGGETQRLLISRLYIHRANVIVLDEFLSQIDPVAESELMEKLLAEFSNKIIIFISHRMSQIRYADRIALIDSGRIIEEGSVLQLLQNKSVFHDLFENKNINFEKDSNC